MSSWKGYAHQAKADIPIVAIPTGAPREYKFEVNVWPRPKPKVTEAQVSNHKAALKTHGWGDPTLHRYLAYCSDVRAAFLDVYESLNFVKSNMLSFKKPFHVDPRFKGVACFVQGWIRFPPSKQGECKHGDSDNIMGAVMDSLFGGVPRTADCHVCPQVMDLQCEAKAPGIRIRIWFPK